MDFIPFFLNLGTVCTTTTATIKMVMEGEDVDVVTTDDIIVKPLPPLPAEAVQTTTTTTVAAEEEGEVDVGTTTYMVDMRVCDVETEPVDKDEFNNWLLNKVRCFPYLMNLLIIINVNIILIPI